MRLRIVSPLLLSLPLLLACSKDAEQVPPSSSDQPSTPDATPPAASATRAAPAPAPAPAAAAAVDNAGLFLPDDDQSAAEPNEPGHRLQLGIDGDPGYTQTEADEATSANAEEPSYAEQPSVPSSADPSNEPSSTTGESDAVYADEGLREARYLERERERARVEDTVEPRPGDEPRQQADEPREPQVDPVRAVRRR